MVKEQVMTKLEAVEKTIEKYEDILEGWGESTCRQLWKKVAAYCGFCYYKQQMGYLCPNCIASEIDLCGYGDNPYREMKQHLVPPHDKAEAHAIALEIEQELKQIRMYLKWEI